MGAASRGDGEARGRVNKGELWSIRGGKLEPVLVELILTVVRDRGVEVEVEAVVVNRSCLRQPQCSSRRHTELETPR